MRQWSVLFDGLLLTATVASAGWAALLAGAPVAPDAPQPVVLSDRIDPSASLWFIDDQNVVHGPDLQADGKASLTYALSDVPADVQLRVHPRSLVEPMLRTLRVLRQAGVEGVNIVVSAEDPYHRDEPTESGP